MNSNTDMRALSDTLDDDILQDLAAAQTPVEVPTALNQKMKFRMQETISSELQGLMPGFTTIRKKHGEWIEAAPGGKIKILNTDDETGAITYLAKLEVGFELPAHYHELAEECLILEGEIAVGGIHLSEGDYHFAPPGAMHGALTTRTGALILLRGALPV